MSTKKSGKVDLFGSATVISKPKAKSTTEDKLNVEVKDIELGTAIDDYEKGKEEKKAAEAKMKKAESILRPFAQKKWLEILEKEGKRPESFIISNKKIGVLFIVQDSYKKLDKDRAEYLKETYGEELVESHEQFMIDPEMVAKYASQLSEAIMKAKNIPDEDKAKIILKNVDYCVKKGTIENILDLSKKYNTTAETLFTEIVPTQQIKSRGEK